MAPPDSGKTMSSRLLTMKFMQRAAAASPPTTPSGPPSKKQRLSIGSSPATPSADAQAVHEALAAEEQKRQEAIDRQAANAGETKWVLSYQDQKPKYKQLPMRIVSAGFSSIDAARPAREAAEDEEEDGVVGSNYQGRKSFGRFNRTVERLHNPDLSSSSDDDDSGSASEDESNSESEEEDDDPTGASALIAKSRKEAAEKARADRKAQKKAAKEEAARMAAKRRSKEVNLNGGISIGGATRNSNKTCFECGQTGHERKDCPRKRQYQGKKRAPPA